MSHESLGFIFAVLNKKKRAKHVQIHWCIEINSSILYRLPKPNGDFECRGMQEKHNLRKLNNCFRHKVKSDNNYKDKSSHIL